MKERIELLLQIQNMSPSQFADEIGVQRSVVSHVLSGRNNPSLEFVTKTLLRFREIRPEWMLFGSGSMMRMGSEQISIVEPLPSHEERNLFSETSSPEPAPSEPSKGVSDPVKPVSQPVIGQSETPPAIALQPLTEKEPSKSTEVDVVVENGSLKPVSRKIAKIILFYNDHSFEEFTPER